MSRGTRLTHPRQALRSPQHQRPPKAPQLSHTSRGTESNADFPQDLTKTLNVLPAKVSLSHLSLDACLSFSRILKNIPHSLNENLKSSTFSLHLTWLRFFATAVHMTMSTFPRGTTAQQSLRPALASGFPPACDGRPQRPDENRGRHAGRSSPTTAAASWLPTHTPPDAKPSSPRLETISKPHPGLRTVVSSS